MDARVGALAGLHVLVVESDRDARHIVSAVLAYHGALVTTARTAADARRAVRHIAPDVVVTELRLPDHDATWLARRTRPILIDLPFIVISAADIDLSRLHEHGFAAYLRKPVAHAELVETVLAIVRR